MSDIKLYGSRGGSSLRVHWLLLEAGVEYEWKPVNMESDERRVMPFLKLNPSGQVPVLVAGDFVLAESLAINNYLAAKYKPELLGASEEEKALVWQWSLWALFNPQKYFYALARETKWENTNDEKVIAKANKELTRFLGIFDARLAGSTYAVGERFTLADINIAPTLSYAEYTGFSLESFPNITRWLKLVTDRPAYSKVAQG